MAHLSFPCLDNSESYNLLDGTIKSAIIFNQAFWNFLSQILALKLFFQVQSISQSTDQELHNFFANIQEQKYRGAHSFVSKFIFPLFMLLWKVRQFRRKTKYEWEALFHIL